MDFLNQFFYTFVHYLRELWLILAVGFLLGGLLHQFIPAAMVERHLGEKGFRSIALASVVGVILPLCCIGTLPVALTLRRKGASLGAVLAFLVATPATSVSALVVCWKLLGFTFTVFIFFAVILIGLVMGAIGDRMKIPPGDGAAFPRSGGCCEGGTDEDPASRVSSFPGGMKEVLKYAFITMPREIGAQILLGIAVASLVVVSAPIQGFIHTYLTGVVGYIFILFFGLIDYTCSTASVPLADALIKSGMSHGQAMTYLIVGPVTSYATILVVKKQFGWKILWLYLAVISGMAVLSGVFYDILIR
ncbi:MAG: permease [Candidatus Omnitrophica bacterium]|nr:permease [Candidatus Omnitrophota bacterium]